MSQLLDTFPIVNHDDGHVHNIDLVKGLTAAHLAHLMTVWRPILIYRQQQAIIEYFGLPAADQTPEEWHRLQRAYGAQDGHWDWQGKANVLNPNTQHLFGLVEGDIVQAVMQADFSRLSRLAPTGEPIVYIDYVAIAPWNRTEIMPARHYRGLGRVMVAAAVTLSADAAWDGRCGLHSLVESEGFYAGLGMTDLGLDVTHPENLRYFEFHPDSAQQFVED